MTEPWFSEGPGRWTGTVSRGWDPVVCGFNEVMPGEALRKL